MKVEQYLIARRAERPLHLTLLDPGKMPPGRLGVLAGEAAAAGTDGIMVGGSTDISRRRVDDAVAAIKAQVTLPVILFPTHAEAVSGRADAIFFMSLLNSTSRQFLVGEQIESARRIRRVGLEVLPMAYLVVAPGMAAGRVGRAVPLPRNDATLTVSHALAGQYFGMRYIYLEAGSGADRPVPPELVQAVRQAIDVTLIVGGGICDAAAAAMVVAHGADIVVTGTLVEQAAPVSEELRPVVAAVHQGAYEPPSRND